jgi:hypothetical protein
MACNCPKPTALTAITATTCPEELGQIQRFIFVRKGGVLWDTVDPSATGIGTPASLTAISAIPTTAAGWTLLKALTDDDKTIFTPLLGGDPVINPSEQSTIGGNDNSTLNGAVYHVGFGTATGSFRFDSLTADQSYQMKQLVCEDLEVYMINGDGDIIGYRDHTAGVADDTWHGFDVSNVAMASRSVQGFASRDSNILTFQLAEDWDENFEKQTPTDFNALTF